MKILIFFQKIFFRNISPNFRHLKIQNFEIWLIQPYGWTPARPVRPARSRQIGQISKFWILRCRNFAKILRKIFFEKKTKFSWEAFVSKYFVSDIVLGFAGAAESLTQSISRISRSDLEKGLFLLKM